MGQPLDNIDKTESLKAAELENIKLENQRLRLEIIEIEKNRTGINKVTKYASLLTTLIAVAGLVIGQFQNYQQQKERERAIEREKERDVSLREQEAKKPFWQ